MFVVKAFAISAVGLGDWSISWGLADSDRAAILGRESAIGSATGTDLLPPLAQQTADSDSPPTAADVPSSAESSWSIRTANRLIQFWQFLWKSLAAGYQAAFIWVSAVGIYLLLRHDIDGAEMDEVFVDRHDDHGLPALEEDPTTGVPETAPARPAQPADPGDAAKAPPSMM
jgi:hypothetical protein